MRAKFSYLLFLGVVLALASASPASAQDEIPGPELNNINTPDPNNYEEKPLLIENEGRGVKVIVKDSVAIRPSVTVGSKAKATNDPKKKEDVDPLDFNFLYYIIQKFKSADLVD